jgi:hypothetical protein
MQAISKAVSLLAVAVALSLSSSHVFAKSGGGPSQVKTSGCPYRKSNPDILVMQAAQDRTAKNVTAGSSGARYGGILL